MKGFTVRVWCILIVGILEFGNHTRCVFEDENRIGCIDLIVMVAIVGDNLIIVETYHTCRILQDYNCIGCIDFTVAVYITDHHVSCIGHLLAYCIYVEKHGVSLSMPL